MSFHGVLVEVAEGPIGRQGKRGDAVVVVIALTAAVAGDTLGHGGSYDVGQTAPRGQRVIAGAPSQEDATVPMRTAAPVMVAA